MAETKQRSLELVISFCILSRSPKVIAYNPILTRNIQSQIVHCRIHTVLACPVSDIVTASENITELHLIYANKNKRRMEMMQSCMPNHTDFTSVLLLQTCLSYFALIRKFCLNNVCGNSPGLDSRKTCNSHLR